MIILQINGKTPTEVFNPMIFSGRPAASGPRNPVYICAILAAALAVAACAPMQETRTEPTQTVPPLPETTETEPAVVCPEPEPVEPQVCPPPPEPEPCPVCPAAKLDGKLVLGAVEYVRVNPPGAVYQARIDTGAEATSIHAGNIVRFERDGEKWVRFQLDNPNGEPHTVERQVVRVVRVREPGRAGHERRMKVMMSLTLGPLSEQIEVALDDRSSVSHSLSIGRDFLHNNAIVDVSQKFIAK